MCEGIGEYVCVCVCVKEGWMCARARVCVCVRVCASVWVYEGVCKWASGCVHVFCVYMEGVCVCVRVSVCVRDECV